MTTSVFQLNFSLTQATQTVHDDDDIDYDEKTATGRNDPQRTSNGFYIISDRPRMTVSKVLYTGLGQRND